MILKSEIDTKSQEWKVPGNTVDKDWVLGHLLNAIYSIPDHIETLYFKGGTCLRKCFFEDYRFSEDLDFTALDADFRLTDGVLDKVLHRVTDHTGILFRPEEVREAHFNDQRTGDTVKIRFWGANHRKNTPPPDDPSRWHSYVKLEITAYEEVIFDPTYRTVFHHYSDNLLDPALSIPCYDLKEVMAEKIRSLVQRSYTAPRDYFDIWKLKNAFTAEDWEKITTGFIKKMEFKGHSYTGPDQLIHERSIDNVRRAWKHSLTHQIPNEDLPDLDRILEDLKALFQEKLSTI